jgi:hypothetical protein
VKEACICEAGPNQTLKYVGALRSVLVTCRRKRIVGPSADRCVLPPVGPLWP